MQCLYICIQLEWTKYNDANTGLDFHSHILLEWLMPMFPTKKGYPVETQRVRWALRMSQWVIFSPRISSVIFHRICSYAGEQVAKFRVAALTWGAGCLEVCLAGERSFSESYHIVLWENMINHYFMWQSLQQGQWLNVGYGSLLAWIHRNTSLCKGLWLWPQAIIRLCPKSPCLTTVCKNKPF